MGGEGLRRCAFGTESIPGMGGTPPASIRIVGDPGRTRNTRSVWRWLWRGELAPSADHAEVVVVENRDGAGLPGLPDGGEDRGQVDGFGYGARRPSSGHFRDWHVRPRDVVRSGAGE